MFPNGHKVHPCTDSLCAVKLYTQTLIHTQPRGTVFDVLAKVNSDKLEVSGI